MVATLDYVGTKGTHLSTLRSLNQPLLNANGTVMNANGSPVFPYPLLGPVEYRDNGGNSSYHGGEITLESDLAADSRSVPRTPIRNPSTSRRSTLPQAAPAVLRKTTATCTSGAAERLRCPSSICGQLHL